VPKDLENVKWPTWLKDIENGYAELKKTCGKVYVGGTSIGAVLTMMLAKENPEISGIILMATPFKIKQERLVSWAAVVMLLLRQKYRKKFYPPTFGLSSTITRLISYQTYPIKSALETFDLIKTARKNLKKITQPCLLMQSTHDHIVTKNSMEDIYARIASASKKKKYIHKAYHTFISDIKNEHVFVDILDFLEEN
jgi:carboxylesterase